MPAAPRIRFLNGLMSRSHVFLYRLTGGTLGGNLAGAPILLLTTAGRRTGRRRTVPLVYVPEGDAFVVIGSNAGEPRQPGWYHNLHAQPGAAVQVRSDRIDVLARDATDEEYARLWPAILRAYPAYGEYGARTSRRIPLVVLQRRDPTGRALDRARGTA